MKLAHASALYAAPVPLRIVIAITFIWAGLGKFMHHVPVQGEQAALLANMGYNVKGAQSANPDNPADSTTGIPADSPSNTGSSPDTPTDATEPADQPSPEDLRVPAQPSQQQGDTETGLAGLPALVQTAPAESQTTQSPASPTYTAADFPEPIKVRSLYNLAILSYNAAHPTPDDEGNTPTPIWPEWAARDAWPRYIAWAAAGTELAAGLLIGIGLLTRLSAVSIAGIMLTAAWLTEIGPAIQSGQTLLGFLPNHDIWDLYAWRPLLWQFSLFAAAVALALTGPGAVAIDRVPIDRDADDEDEDE